MTKLEENHGGNDELLTTLRSQLAGVESEHVSSEKEMSERIAVLTPREQQLRVITSILVS